MSNTIMNLDALAAYEAEGWDPATETNDPDQWERLGRLAFTDGYRAMDEGYLVKSVVATVAESRVAEAYQLIGVPEACRVAFARGWEAIRYARIVDAAQHQLFTREEA